MKTARKSIIISVLTLVIALAVATTGTYAWFAMNTEVVVSDYDLGVTTQAGLFASSTVDGDYTDRLTLTSSSLTNLSAVTPAFDENGKFTKMVKMDGTDAVANTDYYAFDVFFQSYSQYAVTLNSVNVAMKAESGNAANRQIRIYESQSALVNGAVYDFTEGQLVTSTADNAVRMAFVTKDKDGNIAKTIIYDPKAAEGNQTPAAHVYYNQMITSAPLQQLVKFTVGAESYTGYVQTSTVGGSTFEIISTDGLTEGKPIARTNAAAGGEVTWTVDGTNITTGTIANVEYYGMMNETTAVVSSLGDIGSALILHMVDEETSTDAEDTYNSPVYRGKLQILTWIEGKDFDCFDSIYGDVVTVSLGFTGDYILPEYTQYTSNLDWNTADVTGDTAEDIAKKAIQAIIGVGVTDLTHGLSTDEIAEIYNFNSLVPTTKP